MSASENQPIQARAVGDQHDPEAARLLAPRPRLFAALLVVFALWVALLVVLKLATTGATEQDEQAVTQLPGEEPSPED